MSDLVEELLGNVFRQSGVPARSEKSASRVKAIAAKVLRAPVAQKAAPAAKPSKPAAKPVEKKAPVKFKGTYTPLFPRTEKPTRVETAQSGTGRPAPTPAAKVVAPRVVAPKGDYRTMQF